MPPADPFIAVLQDWIAIFMRRSMHNAILYSKRSGLSMSQIGALFRIHRGPSCASHLSDDLGITRAAASQMLERLVQQELIQRREDPHDRRVKQIILTDKGRGILQASLQARQGWLDDLAATLSASEKEQIMAALNILIAKANQLEHPPERGC